MKVANLGLNLKTYDYSICGKRLMPIRWMATEYFSGKFSEKSDVWTFGVTMWELFILTKDVPYPHLSDDEVIQNALKDKYQQFPSRPAICPQPVYQTMQQCWIYSSVLHSVKSMLCFKHDYVYTCCKMQ